MVCFDNPSQRSSLWQSTDSGCCLPCAAPQTRNYCSQYPCPGCPGASTGLYTQITDAPSFFSLRLVLHPFTPRNGFWLATVPPDSAGGHPGFVLQLCYQASLAGISSLLQAHLPPCMSLVHCLSHLLPCHPRNTAPSNDTGLPQLGQAPSERSHPQTRNRSDRVLDFAPFCRLAAPVAPNQVRLRYVPLTSYGFLQTPPLPVTPLPFGLSSPRSG